LPVSLEQIFSLSPDEKNYISNTGKNPFLLVIFAGENTDQIHRLQLLQLST